MYSSVIVGSQWLPPVPQRTRPPPASAGLCRPLPASAGLCRPLPASADTADAQPTAAPTPPPSDVAGRMRLAFIRVRGRLFILEGGEYSGPPRPHKPRQNACVGFLVYIYICILNLYSSREKRSSAAARHRSAARLSTASQQPSTGSNRRSYD